jgi:Na+/proline symporter/signal transduction histidine kinase
LPNPGNPFFAQVGSFKGFIVLQGWVVVLASLAYLTALFAVAHLGDSRGRAWLSGPARPLIYALTLGVYCTSWTFLGSVGLAARSGFDFLPIYIGPMLVIGFGGFLISRIIRLAKENNITSIADFIAARYGKSQGVAAVVTLISVVGVVPYIALQLKAISSSLEVFISRETGNAISSISPIFGDISLIVAVILAFFVMIFGTRQVDTTEHQNGLMIAVAMESVIKLIAFLAVGAFVVWGLFGGLADLYAQATARPEIVAIFTRPPDLTRMTVVSILAAAAILLLPRQFHVMVVENRSLSDVRRTSWLFPMYLVAINLFVIPIAVAGLLLLPDTVDRDLAVLALPISRDAGWMALFTFIGAISAATAMVIVECVALAIMISNDIFMPLVLSRRRAGQIKDMGSAILIVRRASILLILLLGYAYYRASTAAELASIGLLAFAAIAQIAPVFVGGLFWRRATSRGAIAGMSMGLLLWAWLLLLPSLQGASIASIATAGMLNPGALKALFSSIGINDALVIGVIVSLSGNILAYVLMSLTRRPSDIETLQANVFIATEGTEVATPYRLWRSAITIDELRQTVERYLGEARCSAAFVSYASSRGMRIEGQQEADPQTLRFAEHLLASAIGASSSRLVLSHLLRRRTATTSEALQVLDEASAVMQTNRALMQNALDHTHQGVTVLDKDMRLMACNRAFQDIFDLPSHLVQGGVPIKEIIAYNVDRGLYGTGVDEDFIRSRLENFADESGDPTRLRLPSRGTVIDIRTNRLPDGGRVTTYTDITESVLAEEQLERANETLERRVRERTEELTSVNSALSLAKAEAEEANVSKTKFLAAASHDILQPLNAARLYTSALVERVRKDDVRSLAQNADASLDAVEDIITALLDISRLDAGAMKPEFGAVSLGELFRQLAIEFDPVAKERNLKLVFVQTGLWVKSDRRLLRRLLQNLISNAIKYTPSGKVLVGCRRQKGRVRILIIDTGIGIPKDRQKAVFQEFRRLDEGARVARGLGLGLSIVERIGRVLDHKVALASIPGKGTSFSLLLPTALAVAIHAEVAAPARQPSTLAKLRVLCIDNEPAILDGMKVLLEGWGCIVLTATTREDLLAIARKNKSSIDAVVADYHLDKDDGLSVVTALRLALQAQLPATLLTADRTTELREEAALRDIQMLNKPIRPAQLRAWLSRVGVQRAAAE